VIRVCPNPLPWNDVFQRLTKVSESRSDLPKPPVPLILNGWVFSSDVEKMQRWKDTVLWASDARCKEIVESVAEEDFYYTDELTTYEVAPLGGPMCRSWDFSSKSKPDLEALSKALQQIADQWSSLADGFSSHTRPLGFTGAKARRLVVGFTSDQSPPWGYWDSLSPIESKRRTFTAFRQVVNDTIKPLEVDHIDFMKTPTEQGDGGHPTTRPVLK
jgi:hypothetical protein